MTSPDRNSYAPNGSVTAAVNGRIRADQVEYLRQLADDLETTLSGALRRAIDQSQLLDMARQNEELIAAIANGETIIGEIDGAEIELTPAHIVDAKLMLRITPTDPVDPEDDPA